MPEKIVRAAMMREIEKAMIEEYATPALLLMENAAFGVTKALDGEGFANGRVLIVCGTGNNGGDGLAVLRQRLAKGAKADAVLLGDPAALRGDAGAQWDMLPKVQADIPCVTNTEELQACAALFDRADCIVDAIFGIGLSRPVEGLHRAAIEMINASAKPVIAVDVPSGVESDTGGVSGVAVRANTTVTFQYPKPGHFLFPGKSHTGKLIVHPIGLVPSQLHHAQALERLLNGDIAGLLPQRPVDAHKGSFGRVGIVAGSMGMAGAGLMSASAALRAGAGLVTLCSVQELAPVCQTALPEAMFLPLLSFFDVREFTAFIETCSAVVIGPGLGRAPHVYQAVESVLQTEGLRAVADADALNAMAEAGRVPPVRARAVFTPHVGEMARLCGKSAAEILQDPVACALDAAREWNAVVALKSAATVIAHPGGRASINTTGTPAMAKGGTGDVLAGLIAALMAQGLERYDAAVLGCHLLGLAGMRAEETLGGYGVLASDLADALSLIMRR
ncbi:MAG: NAD(P)H-hydrate dehydratase [Bacillota bacterium]